MLQACFLRHICPQLHFHRRQTYKNTSFVRAGVGLGGVSIYIYIYTHIAGVAICVYAVHKHTHPPIIKTCMSARACACSGQHIQSKE